MTKVVAQNLFPPTGLLWRESFLVHCELEGVEHFTMKDFRRSVITSLTAEAQVCKRGRLSNANNNTVHIKKSKPHVDTAIRLVHSKHQPKRCTKRR